MGAGKAAKKKRQMRAFRSFTREVQMTEISRRNLIVGAGAGAVAATSFGAFAIAQGAAAGRVIVIGGGAGGASAARALKLGAPALSVTLIEPNRVYSSSFFSNLYLGGFRSFASLNHNYDGLRRLGVRVVHQRAVTVNTSRKTVRTSGGQTLPYDKLVVSPGIQVKYDSVPGYSRAASDGRAPHAYTTDGAGKQHLRRLLEQMPNGGTVAMVMPNNPYRCPPGPYERACMIAHFLKTRKPKSRLVIFDPKKAFSKQPVFTEAFNRHYKDIIELNLSDDIDDFSVTSFDARAREITTKAGKKVKFDVANVIPQQSAGQIALRTGLAKGDWCPVNPENFSSALVKDVYVLGDATIAAEMPKSAFSANSQAKVAANDILAEIAKGERFPARFRNTCWSLLAPDDNVKVGANYTPKGGKLEPSGSFVSKPGEDTATRAQNYQESIGWYSGITADMFAGPQPAAGKKKG
jgi:sulfide dehydrogenase [flavocytochrome c] flavoprotein chain